MQNEHERVLDALYAIPSDLPREQWVKVGMAFHAAGGDFEEYDRWSAQADCYGEKACQDTWRSFKSVAGGISVATLYRMAKDHGWTAQRSNPSISSTYKPSNTQKKQIPHADLLALWERGEPATYAHPYIADKSADGVPLDDLRVLPKNDDLEIAGESMAGSLVVPVRKPNGVLSTLQFIALPEAQERLKAKGKPGKLNLPNAKVEGWHSVGDVANTSVVYVCEGIGAAWACWQATGAASVVCFGWGRVAAVASEIRKLRPAVQIVLVPDVGKEQEAIKIAKSISGLIAALPSGWAENSDVNDLAQAEGLDVLEALLNGAVEPPKPPPLLKPVTVGDVLTNPAPPPQFMWDGYLPCGVVSLLGAHGGTGKSTIALMLTVCAALGRPLFGIETVKCKTLFVSLEDSANVVRYRLAFICQRWGIDPANLDGNLYIVDGTENPELFTAESRAAGELTATYFEMRKLVQVEGIGLVVVDNASDAYGGDEIQRRQVRAFIRALGKVSRLTNCAMLLLAHVDKNTSRAGRAEGGEGYSGSTAWHNSVRSRLFMTREKNGDLELEHQKSNFGQCCPPLTLEWPHAGLPQLAGHDLATNRLNPLQQRAEGREDDERAIQLMKMIAEFESRKQYCNTPSNSTSNVYAVLKSEPAFRKMKLSRDDVKRIINQCQRAKWIEPLEYKDTHRKWHERWTLTSEGRLFAGLSVASALSAPTNQVVTGLDIAQGGAPSAPTGVGGVGEERAHFIGLEAPSTDELIPLSGKSMCVAGADLEPMPTC